MQKHRRRSPAVRQTRWNLHNWDCRSIFVQYLPRSSLLLSIHHPDDTNDRQGRLQSLEFLVNCVTTDECLVFVLVHCSTLSLDVQVQGSGNFRVLKNYKNASICWRQSICRPEFSKICTIVVTSLLKVNICLVLFLSHKGGKVMNSTKQIQNCLKVNFGSLLFSFCPSIRIRPKADPYVTTLDKNKNVFVSVGPFSTVVYKNRSTKPFLRNIDMHLISHHQQEPLEVLLIYKNQSRSSKISRFRIPSDQVPIGTEVP
jgi:hypothetical protein